MAHIFRYTRPQTMEEDDFKACAEWAHKMDQAVWEEGDLPMSAPPFLYDAFRRTNPSAIDPRFALNLQRTRRFTLYQQEAGRVPGQAESEMVSLKAVEVMLNMTRTMLSDSQHQAGQQLNTAAQAIQEVAKIAPPPPSAPVPPRPGYERRVQHRRPNAPPPPRRPRNSIRRGHPHVHVPHVHVPHVHLDCGRHGPRDNPPPYRRHRRARRDPTPEPDYNRGPTPHPLEGFLFQGVGAEPQPDEDQIMRDETPFDLGIPGSGIPAPTDFGAAGPVGPAPVDFEQPRSPIASTPARTDVSVAGTETPRLRSPITEAAPEDFLGVGGPDVPPGLGLENGFAAPANTEYAGSVTEGFENLDLGAANQLLDEFINPEAIFYGATVEDTLGRPFELNERVSTAVSSLGTTKNLIDSTRTVLNRIINSYESSCSPRGTTHIKFIEHSQAALLHHPRKSLVTPAKPDLVAILEPVASSYIRDVKARRRSRASGEPPAIAWHHVLAGIFGNDDEEQLMDQMFDFLGALNQARPDLPGCFSMTVLRDACRLWWSDAAGIYTTPRLAWDDPATPGRLLSFVHHLYQPLLVDSTILLESIPRRPATYCQKPVWLIEDGLGGAYRAEHVVAVGMPWTIKNWIVVATEHRSDHSSPFTPCPRVFIKDIFPLIKNEGFVEDAILTHLHSDGVIPGICTPISSFIVTNDGVNVQILRCAHEHRGVLHRDISLRNILHRSSTAQQSHPRCKFASEILAHKYPALSASPGPACVLIDFDNATWEGRSPDWVRLQRVGTVPFVARSISGRFKHSFSCPPSRFPELVGEARDCYLQAFGQQHYDDRSSLLDAIKPVPGPLASDHAVHRPHHDAESCYWAIVHFLTTARPLGTKDEDDTELAEQLIRQMEQSDFDAVVDLRYFIANTGNGRWAPHLHPRLRGLDGFLAALSDTILPVFDLYEPQPELYHLNEAMQRILLQEACRLLDTGPIALDTQARRAFHSHHHKLPTALRPRPTSPSRKRGAEDLDDRDDAGPRARLDI
ncbi:hypothetical protein AURDEDRAFT_155238 [Auricularia subglabra TFB-10046 SS5]|nr:hypothetical protein AURDEDRAFT_155238 [Auricularia subglabra TFB-10046 SS5]